MQTDPANCGTCNLVCNLANATVRCTDGTCVVDKCDSGFENCSGDPGAGCQTDLAKDRFNCGECNTVCPANQVCDNGACGTCPDGQTVCKNDCKDLANDANHCGKCGQACQNGQSCEQGLCTGCPTGLTDCNGVCQDLGTDPNNCGTCGNTCSSGQSCEQGVCAGCLTGLTDCNGQCVDTQQDQDNCGECGKACQNDQFCSSGQCTKCKTCGPADCGTFADGCGGMITCSGLGCTCPAHGTLCDGYRGIAPPCNNGLCLCAERADEQGNVCYSGGSSCGSNSPICLTDADCERFVAPENAPLARCIKAGVCALGCNQTACVVACADPTA